MLKTFGELFFQYNVFCHSYAEFATVIRSSDEMKCPSSSPNLCTRLQATPKFNSACLANATILRTAYAFNPYHDQFCLIWDLLLVFCTSAACDIIG